jgi:hypothetical protein
MMNPTRLVALGGTLTLLLLVGCGGESSDPDPDVKAPTDSARTLDETQEPNDSTDPPADVPRVPDTAPPTSDVVTEPIACKTGTSTCPVSWYCESTACDLGLDGVCVPRPNSCPAIVGLVCGCDEQTYDSACIASMSGVNVASDGPCAEGPQECIVDGENQCSANQYCKGACTGLGVCTQKPDTCVDEEDFMVCGCDYGTYNNPCLAALVGMNVRNNGKCIPPDGQVCTELGSGGCYQGQYCNIETCDAGASGKCKNVGEMCLGCTPECGCDGVTYETKHARMKAGAAKKHDGPCNEDGSLPICDLSVLSSCAGPYYCAGALGCTGEGECKSKPLLCIDLSQNPEVCGCAGQTYPNACQAYKAGVPIDHSGVCSSDA